MFLLCIHPQSVSDDLAVLGESLARLPAEVEATTILAVVQALIRESRLTPCAYDQACYLALRQEGSHTLNVQMRVALLLATKAKNDSCAMHADFARQELQHITDPLEQLLMAHLLARATRRGIDRDYLRKLAENAAEGSKIRQLGFALLEETHMEATRHVTQTH
jgi:hypothetical protein